MKKNKELIFEFKSLGINTFVPLILMAFALITIVPFLNNTLKWIEILKITQTFVPISMAWISIFLFENILQEKGSEVIFTYPIKRINLGIKRVIKFFFIYVIPISMYSFIIYTMIGENCFLNLLFLNLYEGFFFAALGFLSVTIVDNCAFALCIIICYIVSTLISNLRAFSFIDIFAHNDKLPKMSQLIPISIKALFFSMVFMILGQIIFNKYKNYK